MVKKLLYYTLNSSYLLCINQFVIMSVKIPQEFIDNVLNRVDIVEIINSKITLKKVGQNFVANCPFHNERTPSFTVNQHKQFYYCFGCGATGSAIGFLMDYERLNFREAIEHLSRQSGLELPKESNAEKNIYIDLHPSYEILAQADIWFRRQLRIHKHAPTAINYLKTRGLTGQIAKDYGLGYAPPGWDELRQALGVDAAMLQILVQNGLLIEKLGQYHDRFRDRIMFPIRDRQGRTIGFGGRVLGEDKPKYLNSPETPLFHKGQELYGLFEARRTMHHIEQLLVVEGYMDVIALAQFNIHYAVATLGTATTIKHIEILFRICNRLIFCFDGDQAGQQAAWRAANVVLPVSGAGREIKFLLLPEGEDPDSYVRKIGTTAFEQQLSQAQPLSEVIFAHLSANLDLNSIDGKARLVEQARPVIEQIPTGIYRDLLFAHLEKLTGLSITAINSTWQKSKSRSHFLKIAKGKTPLTLARRAIALILQHPPLATLALTCPTEWQSLQQHDINLLVQLINILQLQPNLTTAVLVERWRDTPEFAEINHLVQYGLQDSDADLHQELLGVFNRLNILANNQHQPLLPRGSRPSNLTAEQKAQIKQSLERTPPSL